MTDPIIKQLTDLIERQAVAMEAQRKESTEREERMQLLLAGALKRIPPDEGEEQKTPTTKIPSSATPAPHLSHNASLREFSTWKQKFKDYILLTGVDNASNNQQKAVLRSLLDDEWFRIVKFTLNLDMEEEETTVDAILEEMQELLGRVTTL